MAKYLVLRMESITPAGTVRNRNSNHFPMIVETHSVHSEQILEQALDSINEGYRTEYEYLIVLLTDNAKVVSRKPKREYVTVVRDF